MERYKFKLGDKVRIKPEADLTRLRIFDEENIASLMSEELNITDTTPGGEVWDDEGVDGQPTYSVSGHWRIPQSFLEKIVTNEE